MLLDNCLQDVILFIYRLELDMLMLYAVCAALIFCTLYRKWCDRCWLRVCIGLALIAWFAAVLWLTVLRRNGEGSYSVSWIPLHTYWRVLCGESPDLLRSAYMNAVLFYPAGLLLGGMMPQKWSFRRGMLYTVLVFMLFSLSIELCQYFLQLGTAEIDDVLHNTLGAGLGYAAFHLDLDDTSSNNRR